MLVKTTEFGTVVELRCKAFRGQQIQKNRILVDQCGDCHVWCNQIDGWTSAHTLTPVMTQRAQRWAGFGE